MTAPTPTPEEHRRYAEELLKKVYEDAYAPMHPYRVDMLNRATVHALLAAGGGVAPASTPVAHAAVAPSNDPVAAGKYDAINAIFDLGEDAPSKPLPRKRAARKTTAPKETTK